MLVISSLILKYQNNAHVKLATTLLQQKMNVLLVPKIASNVKTILVFVIYVIQLLPWIMGHAVVL